MTANTTNFSSAIGLRPGDKIDKYEVVSQVGAGGFSVVWKAYDRLLDKHVAVKQVTVDSTIDEETFRERFRAEAAIQKKAAQEHKHLVRIIDFIEDPRGMFIVMEFVDGPSLEHMLAQNPGPVDVKTALGIAAAAAVAIGALHEQGIVHRDLKPANILLPNAGGLKICDFGLAALMKDQETPAVGTVRYMAPELLNAQQVDGRADIYSLGFMLYEMLIGRANFEDAFKIVLRDQRNMALRWMKWHTNLKVKAPPIRQYVPAVPEAIAQLVERMMEKDAGQRIASAPQLLDAMRRQLAGAAAAPAAATTGRAAPLPAATIGAGGPVGDKTVKVKKSNKLVVIAAVTILVWTVLGIGYLLYSKNEVRKAEEAKRSAVRDDYMAAVAVFKEAEKSNQDWDKPIVAFKELARKHPDFLDLKVPVAGEQVKSLEDAVNGHVVYCEARQEFNAGNFLKAGEKLTAAENNGSVDMKKIRDRITEAATLGAIDAGEAEIMKLVAEEKWYAAKDRWAKLRLSVINLTPEHRDRWDDLLAKINQLQQAAEAKKVLAEAERIAETDPAGAIEHVNQHLAKHPGNRVLEAYVLKLTGQAAYENAITRAKAAEADADSLDRAIDSYKSAMTLDAKRAEADGLPTKIRVLTARVLIAHAKKDLAGNDADAAMTKVLQALQADPENAEAKRMETEMKNTDQVKTLRRLAVTAFESKEYEKSIDFWKQIRDKFAGDPVEIGAEITKCEFQIALREMEAAWLSGDEERTLKAIARVMELDPAHERATLLKSLIDTRKRIYALIASGNAQRDKVEYGEAKREFRKAIDIAKGIPDQGIRDQLLAEANKALDEVEYIDCFSKAKRDLDLDKLDTAKAWVLGAIRAKSTPEAKALLGQIEAALAKKQK